jgi:hypothetical protein
MIIAAEGNTRPAKPGAHFQAQEPPAHLPLPVDKSLLPLLATRGPLWQPESHRLSHRLGRQPALWCQIQLKWSDLLENSSWNGVPPAPVAWSPSIGQQWGAGMRLSRPIDTDLPLLEAGLRGGSGGTSLRRCCHPDESESSAWVMATRGPDH